MNTSLKCYLCGSSKCNKIHDKVRYDFPFKPYRCDNCGLVFLFPYFTPTEERVFYECEYRKLYDDGPPEKSFKDNLPESRARVERFNYLFSKDKDVLEIGCSSGYFLFELQRLVKSITGVELTAEYADYAKEKGIPVVNAIDELEDDRFDLIFMFHVLEHLNDPVYFLEEVRNKLKTNGKLVIEVPNVEDVLVHTYKVEPYLDFYWQPAHVFYFSKNTLSMALDKAGGYSYTIFPLQRYDLSNHIYWMLLGKNGGQGYFNNIFSEALLREYEKTLKEKFICDTIYAVAEKTNI